MGTSQEHLGPPQQYHYLLRPDISADQAQEASPRPQIGSNGLRNWMLAGAVTVGSLSSAPNAYAEPVAEPLTAGAASATGAAPTETITLDAQLISTSKPVKEPQGSKTNKENRSESTVLDLGLLPVEAGSRPVGLPQAVAASPLAAAPAVELGVTLVASQPEIVFPVDTTKDVIRNHRPFWPSDRRDNPHHNYNAADIFGPTGTPVRSPVDGFVTSVGDHDNKPYGSRVQIKSARDGTLWYLTHLKDGSISVRPGQDVSAGQHVGAIGTRADAVGTPEHLHIDRLPSNYTFRPGCSGRRCRGLPFILIQPQLVDAFQLLPESQAAQPAPAPTPEPAPAPAPAPLPAQTAPIIEGGFDLGTLPVEDGARSMATAAPATPAEPVSPSGPGGNNQAPTLPPVAIIPSIDLDAMPWSDGARPILPQPDTVPTPDATAPQPDSPETAPPDTTPPNQSQPTPPASIPASPNDNNGNGQQSPNNTPGTTPPSDNPGRRPVLPDLPDLGALDPGAGARPIVPAPTAPATTPPPAESTPPAAPVAQAPPAPPEQAPVPLAHVPNPYRPIILEASDRFDADPRLVAGTLWTENRGFRLPVPDKWPTSEAGAEGPMQFMPDTWRAYGVDGNDDGKADPQNLHDAIHAAARYLASMGGKEGLPWGDISYPLREGALLRPAASYNTGPGNVDRLGPDTPLSGLNGQTRKHVILMNDLVKADFKQ